MAQRVVNVRPKRSSWHEKEPCGALADMVLAQRVDWETHIDAICLIEGLARDTADTSVVNTFKRTETHRKPPSMSIPQIRHQLATKWGRLSGGLPGEAGKVEQELTKALEVTKGVVVVTGQMYIDQGLALARNHQGVVFSQVVDSLGKVIRAKIRFIDHSVLTIDGEGVR